MQNKGFQIVSSEGVDLGAYLGNTEREALEAMARDTGYSSLEDSELVTGVFEGVFIPVEF